MMNKNFEDFTSIANSYGINYRTLQGYIQPFHWVDMIQLGYNPTKRTIPPKVTEYIKEVVIQARDRKQAFPALKDLA